jgi:hemolysin activation/secretion protein
VRLRAEADAADPTGAINQLYFVFSQGIEGLGSGENGSELLSRGSGRVDFTKMELTLSRMQPLGAGFSVLLAVFGQYAMTPLLTSELCGYGGRLFGRAFDPSELTADNCVEGLAELRFDIPNPDKLGTQMQFYGYWDHGHLHNLAPVAGTLKTVDASSLGAGVRLGWVSTLFADVSVAKAVQGPRDDTRTFLILTGRL